MKDRADEQAVARLLPVPPLFECSFRLDQYVGDILDVAHFVRAAANFEQRLIAGRGEAGRIEHQRVAEPRAPVGSSTEKRRVGTGGGGTGRSGWSQYRLKKNKKKKTQR